MEIINIKLVIFLEELDLLWIIENQRSEKYWNKHFGLNHQIDNQMISKS